MSWQVRNTTLESLGDHMARAQDPIVGGVPVAAVSASLGLSVLAMTLEVTSRRKDFSGDRERLLALWREATNQAERMAQYADHDTAAYQRYRDTLRQKQPVEAALRSIIESPLAAAEGAARGLDCCGRALPLVARAVLPDLGAAATLLAAAARAMLFSVADNLSRLPAGSEFGRQARQRCRELEAQVTQPADRLIQQVRLALGDS